MPLHLLRSGAESYGAVIGIIHVPVPIPFAPGGVGNARSFPYPVVYRSLDAVAARDLDAEAVEQQVTEAAQWLEQQGVAAITSDCGRMVIWQAAVSSAVDLPVLLSPLSLLPLISTMLGTGRRRQIAIIAARASSVSDRALELAGRRESDDIIVAGMEGTKAFRAAVLDKTGVLDTEAVEREAVEVALNVIADNPDVGAFLLECADLPGTSAAIAAAVQRPVFDYLTMIDQLAQASEPRRFV